MQRLFGPVFQGADPIANAAQGGDQTGAFAGLMAEGGDSPPRVDEAGEVAVAPTVDDTAIDASAVPLNLPMVVSTAAQRVMPTEKQTVGQPQEPIARIMLGSPISGRLSVEPRVSETAAAEDNGSAPKPDTARIMIDAGGDPWVMVGLGDGRAAAIVLDAALLGKAGAPPLPASVPLMADGLETAQAAEGVIASQSAIQINQSAPLLSIAPVAATPQAVPEIGAMPPSLSTQNLVNQTAMQPAPLPAVETGRMAKTDGLAPLDMAEAVQVSGLNQPPAPRQKAPAPQGAIAALQIFAQGAAGPLESATTDEPVAPPSTDIGRLTAPSMAAVYAPTTPNAAQLATAVPAVIAGQWGEVEAEAGDLSFGEVGFAGFSLGEGRGAAGPIFSTAAPAGTVFAGQAPTAAQISAQILPLAQSAQSGPVELVLSPAELGHLRFEIHHRGEQVQIVLSAERPETLDLLRRNSEQLLNDFRNAGFTGASLSFGGWGAGRNEGANPQAFESETQSSEGSAPALAALPTQSARFAPPSTYLDPSRSLNLRL